MLTASQRALLMHCRDFSPLSHGYIEASINTGLHGAVLRTVERSCRRYGWLNRNGEVTELGLAALDKADAIDGEPATILSAAEARSAR